MTKTPLQRIEEFLNEPQGPVLARMVKIEFALRYAIEHTDKTNPYFFLEIANILDGDEK